MKVVNINRLLYGDNIEIVIPSNKDLNNFCIQSTKLYIKNKGFIFDENKILSSSIYWHLKEKELSEDIKIMRPFFIMCKHKDVEIILECGYHIYDKIKDYNFNNGQSNLVKIKRGKVGPYNSYTITGITRNIEWNEYNTELNIKEAYNKFVKPFVLNIYQKEAKKILDDFFKQYNLNYNFFNNKIRTNKLNTILND